MGLLTPCFVPGEGFLYTIIVPGGGFLLPSSRVPGVCPGGGWFWMKLIPALVTPAMKSTQTAVNSERTADLEQKTIISHEDEKVALVLSLTGIFSIWFIFR